MVFFRAETEGKENGKNHSLKQMCVTGLNKLYFLEQDALLTSTGRS